MSKEWIIDIEKGSLDRVCKMLFESGVHLSSFIYSEHLSYIKTSDSRVIELIKQFCDERIYKISEQNLEPARGLF